VQKCKQGQSPRPIWRGLLAVVWLLSAPALWAQPETGADTGVNTDSAQRWALNLYFENDLFSATDQGYTNGLRVSWVSPDVSDYLEDETLPAWIRSINRQLTFFHKTREGLQRNVTFSIGQTIYTPQDLNRTDLIAEDRPYAGWLFASLGYQTRNDGTLDTLETRLGIVGPGAFGQEGQNFIHKLRDFELFKGWDNQLDNELGLMFVWEHKKKYTYIYNENSRFGFDLLGHSGISLGNVATNLNAGFEARLGWAIPDDFGTSALRPGGDNSTPRSSWDPRTSSSARWGVHAFISVDARLVGRDIFLDGNTFEDSHSVTKKRLVADSAVGVSMIYGRIKMSYAQIFRSKEFVGQQATHAYGSLAVSYLL
jgi:lipid A 3-O-deacylase